MTFKNAVKMYFPKLVNCLMFFKLKSSINLNTPGLDLINFTISSLYFGHTKIKWNTSSIH